MSLAHATRPFTSAATRKVRWALVGLCLMFLGACSDSVTQPGMVTPGLSNVTPAVTDARMRLTVAVADIAVRQQLILGLSDLEIALRQGNAQHARDYLNKVEGVFESYRKQSPAQAAADLSAIQLALDAVSAMVSP